MLETLQQDLNKWGPEAENPTAPSLTEAENYTRQLALGHYENFPVVTWMLPQHLRQHFYNVYAFCRWADDLGDEIPSAEESLRLLSWWRNQLELCEQGTATHPVYVALARTIRERRLSVPLFHDLITAFERDQWQNRYPTQADLLDYCRYSANPVGRILLELTECASPENFQLSDHVCTGLQLINFWQDVARDWKIQRVYLPLEDMEKYGVTETTIAEGHCTPEFRLLLKDKVHQAELLLNSGSALAERVSRDIRFDIRLFALGGLRLCQKIRQQDYDVLSSRPKLNKSDIPGLFWHAWRGTGFQTSAS